MDLIQTINRLEAIADQLDEYLTELRGNEYQELIIGVPMADTALYMAKNNLSHAIARIHELKKLLEKGQ